ncbi:hypothetical protein [Longitalea arenae]|uniref:hypothetical protein n=1 Tax=Longitalea arenae TaxID=2812558 RepID=UPI00196712DE|nr:hypothetical protein [Longitalea arenae]
MQKLLFLNLIGLLLVCLPVIAQKSTADSLSLVSKIEADSARLKELQSELDLKMMSKQEAVAKAHRSASENVAAADRLSDDPRNKRLAKRADQNASEARRDAKTARRETERVNKLDKEIRTIKKRIARNQTRLNKFVQQANMNRAAGDTTQ